MKCREIEHLLVELADGTIGEADRSLVESHLAGCAACAADAALLSETFSVLRGETIDAPPAHYFSNLLPKLRVRLDAGRLPWHTAVPAWLHQVLAPLTVTALAVILVGLFRLFEPTEEFTPLKNFVGQVPGDEIAALVSLENGMFESDLTMSGSGKILDLSPNAGRVADRMKADLLADELPAQAMETTILNDENGLDELDDDAVSQVLNRMNDRSTL